MEGEELLHGSDGDEASVEVASVAVNVVSPPTPLPSLPHATHDELQTKGDLQLTQPTLKASVIGEQLMMPMTVAPSSGEGPLPAPEITKVDSSGAFDYNGADASQGNISSPKQLSSASAGEASRTPWQQAIDMDSGPAIGVAPLALQTPSPIGHALSTSGEAENSVEEEPKVEELSRRANEIILSDPSSLKVHPSPRKGRAHHQLLALVSALSLAGMLISIVAMRKK